MLEAMASGCLIVTSKTAPAREVAENGNVVLTKFDPLQIAEKIIKSLAVERIARVAAACRYSRGNGVLKCLGALSERKMPAAGCL